MAKKAKSREPMNSVLRKAKEVGAIEQRRVGSLVLTYRLVQMCQTAVVE